MKNKKSKIQAIILVAFAWLIALSLAYLVLVKIHLLMNYRGLKY
jgi:hypothetical protein